MAATYEYRRFQQHIPVLTGAVTNVLPELALLLYAKGLFTYYNWAVATNPHTNASTRARRMMRILLDKVAQDRSNFYRVGRIMAAVPGLRGYMYIFDYHEEFWLILTLIIWRIIQNYFM